MATLIEVAGTGLGLPVHAATRARVAHGPGIGLAISRPDPHQRDGFDTPGVQRSSSLPIGWDHLIADQRFGRSLIDVAR
jgi:hypothetical protein